MQQKWSTHSHTYADTDRKQKRHSIHQKKRNRKKHASRSLSPQALAYQRCELPTELRWLLVVLKVRNAQYLPRTFISHDQRSADLLLYPSTPHSEWYVTKRDRRYVSHFSFLVWVHTCSSETERWQGRVWTAVAAASIQDAHARIYHYQHTICTRSKCVDTKKMLYYIPRTHVLHTQVSTHDGPWHARRTDGLRIICTPKLHVTRISVPTTQTSPCHWRVPTPSTPRVCFFNINLWPLFSA